MLDATLKGQLQNYLQLLSRPVEIEARLDDSDAARQMSALLAEIGSVSDRVRVRNGAVAGTPGSGALDSAHAPAVGANAVTAGLLEARTPSFTLGVAGEAPRIAFAGVPLGHELTSLVLALLQTGGHPPRIDAALAEAVRALEGPLEFETYVSLSCQNCPDVVQALNAMAALNPRIRHTMIDGALHPVEVERLGIMAVPAVYLNGRPFAQGRMELADILAKLDGAAARRAAEMTVSKDPFDVLVIGGGPAGAAAAIYAARKGIRTGMAAERVGGQLLDTIGIENFISVKETEGHKLAYGLEQHVATYDVDVMNGQRAEALLPGELVEVRMTGGGSLKTRSLIIATGARWRELDVPGEREYRNKGVAYCPHCDGPLFKGKRVAVIGGGNSGVEAAIDLSGLVEHVTLIEFDAALRADAVLKAKLATLGNVTVITSARTTAVLGDGVRVTGLEYVDRVSGRRHTVTLAGIFVQIGLAPNTDWLKGTLELSQRGEIVVDERGQTSLPGVFAAGDCTTVPYKQIVIAVGEGAKASLSAFDHLIRAPALRAA